MRRGGALWSRKHACAALPAWTHTYTPTHTHARARAHTHTQGFTGLSRTELYQRLTRVGRHHFEVGHAFSDPKSATELAWFYATSADYLFANAVHPALDLGLSPTDGPVYTHTHTLTHARARAHTHTFTHTYTHRFLITAQGWETT